MTTARKCGPFVFWQLDMRQAGARASLQCPLFAGKMPLLCHKAQTTPRKLLKRLGFFSAAHPVHHGCNGDDLLFQNAGFLWLAAGP